MNLMQLIKEVLDDVYNEIDATNDTEKDKIIVDKLKNLSTAYNNLARLDNNCIDYSNPATRFAYIYRYTVAHADYIMQIIMQNIQMKTELCNLFKQNTVKVASIGGGPGSDLLGILKYMIQAKASATLDCHLFDKEDAWRNSWDNIKNVVAKQVRGQVDMKVDFHMKVAFQQINVEDKATWKDFLQFDLFTLSYFVSEVWKRRDKAAPFFNHFMSQMKQGSMLIYIDNGDDLFFNWFDKIADNNYLKRVLSEDYYSLGLSNNEQKRDLEPYLSKFSNNPKINSTVAYRIMRKQ